MYKDWIYHALVWLFTIFAVALATMILFPAVGYAEVPGPVPDLEGFWAAIGANHWPLAVGIGLTLLVWAFRSFVIHKIPKRALPWITLGLAVVGTGATRMVQSSEDGAPWWHGLVRGVLEGLTVGFVAIGWWDAKQSIKRRKTAG